MNKERIAELKAQMEAAQERSRQANLEAREATDRYRDAQLEATGFKGCVAEYTTTRGWGKNEKPVVVRFLVSGIGAWSSDMLRGKVIRADGTLGTLNKECRASAAKNLGPYVPAAAQVPA